MRGVDFAQKPALLQLHLEDVLCSASSSATWFICNRPLANASNAVTLLVITDAPIPKPNPAKPEPNRIRSTHQTSALGGTVGAAAERALPRAPRRGALVLRPDHRHRHVARGVLPKRDDGIPVGAADPHLRLSAICRAAS